MPISIFLPSSIRKQTQIGVLVIEATLSENHEATSQVTQQPVEEGSNISDHIINEPLRVSIEGFISNTPIAGGYENNAQKAFDTLYEIRELKQLITVVTGFKVYDNMAITRINIPRDVQIGDAIRFSVDLIHVLTSISNSIAVLGKVIAPIAEFADQAQSRLNLGRQALVTANNNVQSKVNSALARFF